VDGANVKIGTATIPGIVFLGIPFRINILSLVGTNAGGRSAFAGTF
jgi:hypothetical protein